MKNYIQELDFTFRQSANSEYAYQMKKYMRGKFEYLGIKSPLRREISKVFLQKENRPPVSSVINISIKLWKKPEREFQYFAQELLCKYLKLVDSTFIDHLEYLLTTKSWWDTVDYIAANLVGSHFQNYPHLINPISKKWCELDNLWLQRTSLLFQLRYKTKTDTDLLFNYIRHHSNSKEFFIRKAIGWALREYSKTDPELVIKFVDSNELSGLSKREALKKIK